MAFNLATILTETALAAPEAPVHLFAGTATTYGELDDQSSRFAAGLREAGLDEGLSRAARGDRGDAARRLAAQRRPRLHGFRWLLFHRRQGQGPGDPGRLLYNVYPREIEEVLYAHPAVMEAAVIGRPDERLGEEVVAVVALHPGSELSAEDLIGYCRERLAAYKYPRELQFVGELPKGPSGKILKSALREGVL
jgi:acyl-CoA synthetase (AMP-forming)/AMP-acid ligase II